MTATENTQGTESADVWQAFRERAATAPVPAFITEFARYLPSSGTALDFGSSVGRALGTLLDAGLSVVALDADEQALQTLRARAPDGAPVETVCARFEEFAFDRAYEVILAHYALFFIPRPDFERVWASLVAGLAPGGVFGGQFLGPNDDWSKDLTTCARDEVERLLEPLEVLVLREEDQDGTILTGGDKHWHVFHVIARKPLG